MKSITARTAKNKSAMFNIDEATRHPSFSFLEAKYEVKTGIKATDNTPVIRMLAKKSGTTNAALYASSVSIGKKWARNLFLTNPRIREASTKNIIIVAAEIMVV